MYITPVPYSGNTFDSAESDYQCTCVKFHGNEALAAQIQVVQDPYAAKKLSQKIQCNAEWNAKKISIMREIVKAKFDANDTIRDKLLQTKGRLYEATTDRVFGCGYTLSQRDQIRANSITAGNKLGELLVEYRDTHKKADTSTHDQWTPMNDPAMAISCPKIAIVGDSRTKHFRSLLRNHHINPYLDISVFTYSGTTVVRAVPRFLERDSTGSEYVILLAGVNNLTKVKWSYNRSRHTVSPVFDNIPALVDSLTDSYTEAKMILAREGHQCIICELTGLDINRYCGDPGFVCGLCWPYILENC